MEHQALSERDNADINSIELYSELKHLSSLLPIGKGSPGVPILIAPALLAS